MVKKSKSRDVESTQRALEAHVRSGILSSVVVDMEQRSPFLVEGKSGWLHERLSADEAYWLVIGIRLAQLRYERDHRIADLVFELLDGEEWSADTLQEIGLVFTNLGRPLAGPAHESVDAELIEQSRSNVADVAAPEWNEPKSTPLSERSHCGIHGDSTADGRCASCDAERDTEAARHDGQYVDTDQSDSGGGMSRGFCSCGEHSPKGSYLYCSQWLADHTRAAVDAANRVTS